MFYTILFFILFHLTYYLLLYRVINILPIYPNLSLNVEIMKPLAGRQVKTSSNANPCKYPG